MEIQHYIGLALIVAGGLYGGYLYVRKKTTDSVSAIDRPTAFSHLDALKRFFAASGNKSGEAAIQTAGKALFDDTKE